MIRVEVCVSGRDVVLLISAPDDSDHVEMVMTPDEARELCNGLGEAIKCASRMGILI